MKISKGTISRTICLAIALINQALIMSGKEILPFADDQIYESVSLIFTIVSSIAAWWKNNSFTKAAIMADNAMKNLSNSKICQEDNICELE